MFKLKVIFRILFCKSFLFIEVKNKDNIKDYSYRTNFNKRDDIIYLERIITDLKEKIKPTNT